MTSATRGYRFEANFQGRLRLYQEEAVVAISDYDDGILCAPTAFGKTAVAAWLIAKRKVNTLVLVHRQQLLDQWHERLAMFLDYRQPLLGRLVGENRIERVPSTSRSFKASTEKTK